VKGGEDMVKATFGKEGSILTTTRRKRSIPVEAQRILGEDNEESRGKNACLEKRTQASHLFFARRGIRGKVVDFVFGLKLRLRIKGIGI